jgi:hypothetical protein
MSEGGIDALVTEQGLGAAEEEWKEGRWMRGGENKSVCIIFTSNKFY